MLWYFLRFLLLNKRSLLKRNLFKKTFFIERKKKLFNFFKTKEKWFNFAYF